MISRGARILAVVAFSGVIAMPAAAQQRPAPPPVCAGTSAVAELQRAVPDRLAAAFAAADRRVANGEGRFFRIEAPGVAPSFLFGTMHGTDPAIHALPDAVAAALRGTRVVAVEVAELMEEAGKAQFGQELVRFALQPGTNTLRFMTDTGQRRALLGAMQERGIPAEVAQQLQPWFLNLLLAYPVCEFRRMQADMPILDEAVARGRPQGARLVGLERPEEQLTVLAGMPEPLNRASLALSARLLPRAEDLFATMIDLYRRGRVAAITEVVTAAGMIGEADAAILNEYVRLLTETRDPVMAERAVPLIREGNAFIAVGALHLSGSGGLVQRFRDAGFTVTRVD